MCIQHMCMYIKKIIISKVQLKCNTQFNWLSHKRFDNPTEM